MYINYRKYIIYKINEKYCLDAQKVFVQSRNLASKIKNTCETYLFMLEQNVFIV